ncbi:glycoside hydrolase superfamily, partial [Mycena filopes]
YWGQNSYAGVESQKNLGFYCQDHSINAIPVAFVDEFFGPGGLPTINLANSCQNGTFPGTNLLDCRSMSDQIQSCQANNVLVTISLGGGDSTVGFSSDQEAAQFGETIWNLFLGGDSDTRPFGAAILDGVDLDIEQGPSVGYGAFVNKIRTLSSNNTKRYYVSAAPQCQFPDAYVGDALNTAEFDMIYVQVCYTTHRVNVHNVPQQDAWAKNQSHNSDVKVYIGAAASHTAAGSGYVNGSILGDIAIATQRAFSSFGGVMLWDMSQAYS